MEAGEMARQLIALTDLLENLGSITNTLTVILL